MQISREITRRFQGAINSLGAGSKATRSAQAWSPILWAAVTLCFAVLMVGVKANAQTAGSGSIQGVITDPSGALIPNAAVTITDQATQVKLSTKTSSGGDYAFPSIHIGTYTLTVVAPGFQTFTSTGNILEVGSSISLNEKLTVGSTDTKIEVHANGLALQTEDASFKQTIDKTEIQELPIISNDRSIEGLVQTAGGSNGNSVPGDASGSKFTTQTTGISIAGAAGNAISWRLDGGDNNDYMSGGNNPLPFIDAIGQFSVETAALGAEDGNHIGGLVNIVTQSGTNTYHGSAFEYARRTFLDAENFFSTPTAAQPHDELHQDQYGGTFGGHIIRDKLFAFAAFQHQFLNNKVANSTAYVPTADNILRGDYSTTDPVPVYAVSATTGKIVNLTPANGCSQNSVQLSDPISGAILPGNKYNQPGGPTLPVWNAAALALQKQLPVIDPTVDIHNCGLVSYSIPNQDLDSQFDTRVDYTINGKNTMYARYFLDSEQLPAFYSPTNILLSQNAGRPEIRYQTISLGENFVISSNLVNSVHLTATRRQLARGFNPATPNVNVFGVKDFQAVGAGIWIAESQNNHGFNVGGGSNLLATIDDNIPVDFSDDITWIRGKHQIAIGGSILRNQLNVNNGYESDGNSNFNGIYSGAHAAVPATLNPANLPTMAGPQGPSTGDTNLDLLEGAMSSFTQSKPQQNALRGWIPTIYVQDTFHATPRLTVTAGVNWEPEFFPTDYFHRGVQFSQTAFLAGQHSAIYPQAPAGSFFYGDPGVKPNFTNNSPWQFNPNFAVAYDLSGTGKTVVRAGVAYAYDVPNFFSQQRVQQNAPFSVLTTPNSSGQLCFSDPWLVGGNTNGGLTQGCAQTGGTDVDPFPFNNASFVFPQQSLTIVLPPTYKAPNTVQWTASIQHQFSHGWNAQIFYTGNRTQHELGALPLNPAVYVPGVWGANGTGCTGVVTYGPAAVAAKTGGATPGVGPFPTAGTPCSVSNVNKTGSDPDNTVARAVLTNASPLQGNFYSPNGSSSGASIIESNTTYANYNGVVVTVQHRFSSSFSLLTNYTWSKCLDNADPQGDISGLEYSNPNNLAADYGRCGQNQDVRNILNVSLVLRSAFPIHGIAGYLINNWEVAPLVRLTSGTTLNITQGQDESFTGNGGDRPNFVPGVNQYLHTTIRSDHTGAVYSDRSFLNQAAFVPNMVAGTQGDVSRNSLSGPIYFQNDASLTRIFPIYEKVNLALRLDAVDPLNHPSFSNPGTGASSGSFGGTFGEIGGTSYGPRIFQFSGKVSF
jgi:hypothetical protein